MWNQSSPALTELVYPPRCAACDADLPGDLDDIQLCAPCRRALAPPVQAWCLRCSAPLIGHATSVETCVRCRVEPRAWERAVALGVYRAELRGAILRAKPPSGERLAAALGRLLLERRGESLRQMRLEVVVPVPSHWTRRLARGANAPDLIAGALAARLNLPLRTKTLKRGRLTPLQIDVTFRQRRSVQRRSFRVSAPRHIRGRRVLLVDDVLTTGATANEAARTLLAAGASAVLVAVVARSIGEDML